MLTIHNKHSLLKKYFGFDSFKPNQEAIIDDILSKKDVVAIMPTGGGKSLCFQLPALLLEGLAIVVSPLIALMKDQVDALKANGIEADFYNSSQSHERQRQVIESMQRSSIKLLYVAPESLMLLLPFLQKIKLSLFAIDEAHCISAWGHDFRPAYTQLSCLKNQFPDTPVAAFTATADLVTQEDIKHQLNVPDATFHLASFDRKNLYLEVRPGTRKFEQIVRFLNNHPEESGIIYCLSRKNTETLADKLNQKGFGAEAYHAGLSSEKRTEVQDNFVNDRTQIIVATIAFGMGIDKSNVRWVIHFNMPKNIESYYQEIGRSGRDGLPADTLMFYSYADVLQLQEFAEESSNKTYQLAKLDRMKQYAEALSCRRVALLNYFGERFTENCGNCDMCLSPPKFFDGTILAQKVCSAVFRVKEQESITVLIDVLRGAKNASILEKSYQHLSTYGIAKDVGWLDLQQYIIQMINQGILEIRFHENGRLLLTPLAKSILFEGKKVKLATLQLAKNKQPEVHTKTTSSLFVKLKALRSEIAMEESVPAYVVFSDAALKDMERQMPKDKSEFLKISGVGEAKSEKYGQRFLDVISTFAVSKKPKVTTEQVTFDLYQEGKNVVEIAAIRGLKEDTIYGHLQKIHERGDSIDLYNFISEEEVKTILEVIAKTPNDEGFLKPIFEALEEKVPYWKIRYAQYLG